jgi:hypothetical protein
MGTLLFMLGNDCFPRALGATVRPTKVADPMTGPAGILACSHLADGSHLTYITSSANRTHCIFPRDREESCLSVKCGISIV